MYRKDGSSPAFWSLKWFQANEKKSIKELLKRLYKKVGPFSTIGQYTAYGIQSSAGLHTAQLSPANEFGGLRIKGKKTPPRWDGMKYMLETTARGS